MTDLLFEIGTEEIPAGYIAPALKQMEILFAERAKKYRLELHALSSTGTPRRLTLFVKGLTHRQESVTEEIPGPAASIAFDKEGNPTKAGLGFARSQGVVVTDLCIKKTQKGEYCFAIKKIEGQETLDLLPEILAEIIKNIPFPKSMKWKGNTLFFARPIRSLLAVFGDRVVPLEMNGIKAGKFTFGHPFLSGKRVEVSHADWGMYKQLLHQEKVVVDMNERRDTLRTKITQLMTPYGAAIDDEELLDEVTNLVEYPHAIECSFDEEFLDTPGAVTETAMKEHQRYFPIKKRDGKLSNKFIAVLNRDENNARTAVQGNERVLKARLSDARFFWKEDRKIPLEKRVDDLKNLAFLEKLGNYRDRTDRIVLLAEYLSHRLIALNQLPIEADALAKRTALLCKADLLTQMVGEFPSLQGIMGREYATWDGEEPAIALAIAEHYMPRFATDTIPTSKIGAVVGLADKFDTICSCFAVHLIPTGSQDPYSLRRHAYGIIRIIEECGFTLEIQEVLSKAFSLLPVFQKKPGHTQDQTGQNKQDKQVQDIKDFFRDRLFQISVERGHRYDLVNAVLNASTGFHDIHDLFQRLQALSRVSKESWWPDLVTVVERTFNIGKKANSRGSVDERLFTEPEERTLWEIYKGNETALRKQAVEKRYEETCRAYYEAFARPVHSFFEKVYVNVDDEAVRNNRLLLVRTINELYSEKIADLSQMEMSGGKPREGSLVK
ncbi:MAG: glycine--tRNA ligase subunit beta [Candidatus Brocadia carolinensis]|uniref:Glycine--tRNA ligase beta subunit n=1 Tax=Candidatus Brocadia carolinensis TaxID=1004156 RepID=A0A1V4ARE5_9BACT|nr:MAG: glycine--tRNA ligase subunit beta [Candidatus Brocadia caroliniensis]